MGITWLQLQVTTPALISQIEAADLSTAPSSVQRIPFSCNLSALVFWKARHLYFYKQGRMKRAMPFLRSFKPLYANF